MAEPTLSISVVVPVFNSEKYLDDLIKSLNAQTFPCKELIFVDDGSTDGSLAYLEALADADARVIVFSQENAGGAAARNKGLSAATGDLVICVDSDDFFEPNMLEEMAAPFCDPSVGMVLCNMNAYFEDDDQFKPMPWAVNSNLIPHDQVFPTDKAENLFRNIIGYIGNKMIRRSLIVENDLSFQEIRSHDDLSFVYAAMAASPSLYYVDKELYHYRRRSDTSSVTDTTMISLYECAFIALEDLRNRLIAMGKWDAFQRTFVNYALYLCKWKYDKATPDAKSLVVNDLRDTWFRKLDVLGFPRSFYLNDAEYTFMCTALNYEYVAGLQDKIAELKQRLKKIKAQRDKTQVELDRLRGSRSYKLAKKLLSVSSVFKKNN